MSSDERFRPIDCRVVLPALIVETLEAYAARTDTPPGMLAAIYVMQGFARHLQLMGERQTALVMFKVCQRVLEALNAIAPEERRHGLFMVERNQR